IVQTQKPTGEYVFDYNGNELYHVDLDSKQVVWTLPGLEKHMTYDVQNALQNMKVGKHNLNIMMVRSNHTPATCVIPRVRVYPEHPVVLGEPNILICSVTNIFPPVMNITWLKNGEKIDRGVTESLFLPRQDHSFFKFLYLAFIPNINDIYTCEVEHWGLDEAQRIFWEPDVPPVLSETTETIVCALGLSAGVTGIIIGVFLLMKGMKHNTEQRMRGSY
ncbi:unnamed protein product, partial [Staurois parvus]